MKLAVAALAVFIALSLTLPMLALKTPVDRPPVIASSAPPSLPPDPPSSSFVPPGPPDFSSEGQPIQPPPDDETRTVRPAGTVKGKESFQVLNLTTGKVDTVSLTDYVRGALASEMPATFHAQALKAQAVAAHTYALYNARIQEKNPDPALKGADFSADPSRHKGYITEETAREVYGPMFDIYWSKICEAADLACKEVLTYDGEPILAAYHSTSDGTTESAENVWTTAVPYLTPVESAGDLLAPGYISNEQFTKAEMKKRLNDAFPQAGLGSDPSTWIEVLERSSSDYVTKVRIGEKEVHGQALREVLGLRSTCFEVTYQNGTFHFEVAGYGHGVGLSQYGADYMARQGSTYEEILAHYYPGSTLTHLA